MLVNLDGNKQSWQLLLTLVETSRKYKIKVKKFDTFSIQQTIVFLVLLQGPCTFDFFSFSFFFAPLQHVKNYILG